MNPKYVASISNGGDIGFAVIELTPALKKLLRRARKAYKAAAKVLGSDVSIATFDASVYWLRELPESMLEPEEWEAWVPLEEEPLEALASSHDPETSSLSDRFLQHGVRTELDQLEILNPACIYFSCVPKYQEGTVETPQLSEEMLTWLDSPTNKPSNTTPED